MTSKNIARLKNGRWRARYRDKSGKERARHFDRKVDGQRWLDEVTTAIVTGQYVDPTAGRVTFREYAEGWRDAQPHRKSSAERVEVALRRQAYPTFGDRQIASIDSEEIQAWATRLWKVEGLAPATVRVVHGIVSGVFASARRANKIATNPCADTKLPPKTTRKVMPMTLDQFDILRDALPDRYRALVTFAAGTGVRQGEALGLTVDRIEFLRREVRIDRQLQASPGEAPEFRDLKTETSSRSIPLPRVVVDALAAHLSEYSPGEAGLVFADEQGKPLRRSKFGHIWRPAADLAGLDTGTGLHACRHLYASLLIEAGESVKVVQARLGHKNATETLDTYGHLWPDSEEATRKAVDARLGVRNQSAKSPQAVADSHQ